MRHRLVELVAQFENPGLLHFDLGAGCRQRGLGLQQVGFDQPILEISAGIQFAQLQKLCVQSPGPCYGLFMIEGQLRIPITQFLM